MIKIYHNPKCSKSRQALELLQKKGLTPQIILYLEQGISAAEIHEILSKSNLTARDLLRTKEDEFKAQNLDNKNLNDDELINAIVNTPKLLERPIVINANKAAIGRPTENILEILEKTHFTFRNKNNCKPPKVWQNCNSSSKKNLKPLRH